MDRRSALRQEVASEGLDRLGRQADDLGDRGGRVRRHELGDLGETVDPAVEGPELEAGGAVYLVEQRSQ